MNLVISVFCILRCESSEFVLLCFEFCACGSTLFFFWLVFLISLKIELTRWRFDLPNQTHK